MSSTVAKQKEQHSLLSKIS